jgi:hypothetical protein
MLIVVNSGYKAAAKLYHPDVGGDPQEMTRLNALLESLRTQLDGLA